MARYIDADALYKATEKRISEANSYRMAVVDNEFLDLINDAETADVVDVHGKAEFACKVCLKLSAERAGHSVGCPWRSFDNEYCPELLESLKEEGTKNDL